jgi:Ca2+-binding EF-hand superfamily protein
MDDAAYRSEFDEYDLNKDGAIEKDEIIKVVGSDADEKEVTEFFE